MKRLNFSAELASWLKRLNFSVQRKFRAFFSGRNERYLPVTMSATKLTVRQQRFVDEYLADEKLNATQAAIRAGYSPKTAQAISTETLSRPLVREAIEKGLAARSAKTGIDAEWVLRNLAEMFTADIADAVNPATGQYKPIHEWPPVLRRMLNGLDVLQKGGALGEVVKVKFIDRLKTLETIGRHIGVQAFKDRELTVPVTVNFNKEDVEL